MANEIINPQVARDKATNMINIAAKIDDLFNNVYKEICKIDSEDTVVYQGTDKAAELRIQLEQFSRTFSDAYEQIRKNAKVIIEIANVSEQQ